MTKIDLPGGGWASLRDPEMVTERQRRPLMKAMGRANRGQDADDSGIGAMRDIADALILALVDSWSLDSPVVEDSVLDLPGPVFDALSEACLPLLPGVLPDFGPSPDTDSPTAPSNA